MDDQSAYIQELQHENARLRDALETAMVALTPFANATGSGTFLWTWEFRRARELVTEYRRHNPEEPN